jgi:CHAT domain-containing protein
VVHAHGADGQATLPGASREVEALTATFQPNLHCLCDERATVAELARLSKNGRLAEFEYLHLLAHGQFDERSGRASRLALDDGGLLVDDVADLRLRARVATLSACDSGLREVYPGEEWVGLAQAFLAAGADCVVSGLWRMADEAMPWLIRLFYQNLLAGCGPAAALCAAQRKALKVDREPYYWAPLTAVGLP